MLVLFVTYGFLIVYDSGCSDSARADQLVRIKHGAFDRSATIYRSIPSKQII